MRSSAVGSSDLSGRIGLIGLDGALRLLEAMRSPLLEEAESGLRYANQRAAVGKSRFYKSKIRRIFPDRKPGA